MSRFTSLGYRMGGSHIFFNMQGDALAFPFERLKTFCCTLDQDSLVLFSLGRVPVVEEGAACEGLGISGQRSPSPSHLGAFASGLGSLMVLAPCSPTRTSSGCLVARRPLQPPRPEVPEDFKMKTWPFSLNFKLAHFLLQGE